MSFEFGYALPALNNLGAAPALNINFLSGTLDSRITFTRASTATYYDSTGTLQTAAINAPRFDYNPSTLAARGLLIEEARTNSIRNNTMQGAVAGTPGTAPTFWPAVGSANGITVSIASVGTENGVQYIDLNYSGTATLTGTAFSVTFESTTGIAASATQVWTESVFAKLVSGSLGDATIGMRTAWRDSGGVVLSYAVGPNVTLTTSALNTQRFSFSLTAPTNTAYAQPGWAIRTVNGSTYNVTVRIGLPQLELGAFATSVIPTTTAAATRSQDVATMTGTNFSSWYNQSQGTFVTQFVLEGVKSVAGQRVITTDDGSTTNQMLQSGSSTNTFQTTVTTGGATQVSQTVPSLTLAGFTTYKASLGYAENNTNTAVNGVLATNDTTCTMPTALTTFRFAASTTTVTANVWFASLKFYTTRLANGTLQVLTT